MTGRWRASWAYLLMRIKWRQCTRLSRLRVTHFQRGWRQAHTHTAVVVGATKQAGSDSIECVCVSIQASSTHTHTHTPTRLNRSE